MQRFSQSNVVHQTVFEMIAAEILAMVPQTPGLGTPDSSVHKGTQTAPKPEHHSYATCFDKAALQAVCLALQPLARTICTVVGRHAAGRDLSPWQHERYGHAGMAPAMAVRRLQPTGLDRRIGC